MNYKIEIADTFDREFLTYEIWEFETLVAEVFYINNEIKLNVFKKEFDFNNFLKVLEQIEQDIKKQKR